MSEMARQHSPVLVVGFGLSGQSVARYLLRERIEFDVADECDDITADSFRQSLTSMHRAAYPSGRMPQFFNSFCEDRFARYSLLILSPGIPRSLPKIRVALDAGTTVIGDVELFAQVVDKPVIAVTGSNGKSTVVAWLAHALQHAGVNALACGNIGQAALDSLMQDVELYVLELSSYQLESTLSLQAESVCVLNVSEDHMDRYDGIEQYAAVKRRLWSMGEHRVVNFDDRRTWPEDPQTGSCEFFSIAASKGSEARLSTQASSESVGSEYTSKPQFNTARFQAENPRWCVRQSQGSAWICDAEQLLLDEASIVMPGRHNLANALVVIALAASHGVAFERLRSGLISFRGLPHRSQYVGERNDVRWYNDSKGTNIDACEKAIEAMPGPVLLIAGGISKGADFTVLNDTLATHVRVLILIGRDREQMAAQMTGAAETVLADSLIEAVNKASQMALPGEVVLLSPACSSFDMFRNFEDRGDQFVAAVQQVLAA